MRQRQKLRNDPSKYHSRYFAIQPTKITTKLSTSSRKPNPPNDRSQSLMIIHDIQTSLSLSEIKNHPEVRKFLSTHHIFLRKHHWDKSETNITTLGWFLNQNPSYQSPAWTQRHIADMIQKQNPNKKIPKFKIVLNTPSIRHDTGYVKTKAYAIESQAVHKSTLVSLLSKTFQESKEFIPYHLRVTDPDAYHYTISLQNSFLSSHKVILLHGMSDDILFYLQPHIQSLPTVKSIIQTHKYDTIGEHRVIVSNSHFSSIRKILKNKLDEWFNESPPDAQKANHEKYAISPFVVPIHADDFSSGEESYLESLSSYKTKHSDDSNESEQSDFSISTKGSSQSYSSIASSKSISNDPKTNSFSTNESSSKTGQLFPQF